MSTGKKNHQAFMRASVCAAALGLLVPAVSAPAHAKGDTSVDWLTTRIEAAIDALPSDAPICDIEAAVQAALMAPDLDADALVEVLAIAAVQASGRYNMRVYDALTNVDNLQPRGVAGYAPDSVVTTSCDVPDPCGAWPEEPDPEPEPEPVPEPEPQPEPQPEPEPEPEPAPPPPPVIVTETVEDELAGRIESDVRGLRRNATQCEYEAMIRHILARSGEPRDVQLAALRNVRQGLSGGLAIRRALSYVIQHLPLEREGYSPQRGFGDNMINLCGRRDTPAGGGNPRPPMPPTPGGGDSDYD